MNNNPRRALEEQGIIVPGHGDFHYPGTYRIVVEPAMLRWYEISPEDIQSVTPTEIALPDNSILTLKSPWQRSIPDFQGRYKITAAAKLKIDIVVIKNGQLIKFQRPKVELEIVRVSYGRIERNCIISHLTEPIRMNAEPILLPNGIANRIAGKTRGGSRRKHRSHKTRRNNKDKSNKN